MTNTAIQPAIAFSKTARSNPNASVHSKTLGSSPDKVSPFAGTLQSVLAEEPSNGKGVPPDQAKLLKKLLTALKHLLRSTEAPKSGAAESDKTVQWLKEAITALRKQELTINEEDPNLAIFLQVAHQLQHLLSSSADGEEGPGARKLKMSKLTEQLAVIINRLLGQEKASKGKSRVFPETQSGRIQSNQAQSGFSISVHDKAGELRQSEYVKRGSPQRVQQQAQIHPGPKSGQFPTLPTDSKEVAASVFRRSAVPMEKNGVMGQTGGFDAGPVHRIQQFVLHVRQNSGTAGQQQFIREFQQILEQSKFTMIRGKQQLILKLHPQHLGKLNIQLIHENGQLTARLVASTTAAKNLVEAHLPQLQGAFTNQNLNVQKLQVLLPYAQPDTQQGYEQDDGYNENRDHQEEADPQTEEDGENAETNFVEWLEHLHLSGLPEVKI
ncbi:MAG TPA: flagellar hook-length control protein FliK [Bacillales bacterium]